MKVKLFILFLFFVKLSSSQNITISGHVKDSIRTPLELASIIALDKETQKLAAYSITNSKGKYVLSVKPNNHYEITISFMGYQTLKYDLPPTTTQKDITKDFLLKGKNNQLNEVVLTYKMPVVIKNDTIVYNVDSFTNGTEKKLGDVLKKMPGVEINDDGQIEVEGKQVTKVMVEGKDFFDGDSKLPVENIPSNVIDKIEVLKNFSEVSQLKNVRNNEDNIAINLKLKKGKKTFWFGEIGLGGGPDERYKINPKLFFYSPKRSISILGNTNNIGAIPFTRRDYMNFTGGLRRPGQGSGTSLNLLTENLGLSQLQNNRAQEVITRFGAANFNFTKSKKWGLSGFFIYSESKVDFLEKATKTYINDGTIERTEQATKQKTDLGLFKLSSSYKPNKNLQIDYDGFLKLSKQEETDHLLSRFLDENNDLVNNTIGTGKDQEPFSIKQNINWYHTLNQKNIISAEIQHYLAQEDPFYNTTFFNLGNNPSTSQLPFSGTSESSFPYDTNQENYRINQKKMIKTNKLDVNIDYYYILHNNSHLSFTAASIFSHQNFNSSIFQRLDNGNQNLFTDEAFNNNDVNYFFRDAFVGIRYKLILGKFTFRPGLSFHNYNIKNQQLGSDFTLTENIWLPNFNTNITLSKSATIRFVYNKTAQFADINRIAEGYVFNNYNALFRGNRTIENGIYQNLRLSYSSFSLFTLTNIEAAINYTHKDRDIKNNNIFTRINRESSPINSPETDESLNFIGRWRKTFGKYNVNTKANIGFDKFFNINNSELQKTESFTQNYRASVLTNYQKWPNFEAGYQFIVNAYNRNNAIDTFITHKPFINMEALLFKDFTFKADYSYFNYGTKSQTLNTYSFLDASLSYQKRKTKWEYMLSATNLLNTASINRDNVNQNFSRTIEYFVQPTYIVLNVKYRF